jgi:effector-binding domain-containing protein
MPKFQVRKSIIINAPIEKVFQNVKDFNNWSKWSPWMILEPGSKSKISGTGMDIGDISAWDGELIGAGEMEHQVIEDYKMIEQELRFFKPFKSTSRVSFEFSEEDGGVKVTWTMDGSLPFFLFFMKKMMVAWIGMDFERGLMMLKDYTETGKIESKIDFKDIVDYPETHYIGKTYTCRIDDLGPSMEKAFPELMEVLNHAKVAPVGVPFSIYKKYDMVKREAQYVAAIPVAQGSEVSDPEYKTGKLEESRAIKVVHTGDYKFLGNAWSFAMNYVQKKKLKASKANQGFEVYVTDPSEVEMKDAVTEIYIPLR